MVMRAITRKLMRDLVLLRAQVATTALLIVCGVSLLIASWSAYRSLRDSRDAYYSEFHFADLFCDLKRAPLELWRRIAKLPGVDRVEARIVIDGLVRLPEPAVGRFISIPSGAQPNLNRLYLRKGRLPLDGSEVEVAVHEGFAAANRIELADQLTILVQGRQEVVRVVGIALSPEYVYALSPSAPLPDDHHFGVFWTPRQALERLAGMADAFNNVVLSMHPSTRHRIDEVREKLDELTRTYGSRGSYGRELQQSNRFVENEIDEQRGSAIFTPSIFLIIAAFLVHVITARLMVIHRPQIATLKAIGYSNAQVARHYLELVLLMGLAGAIPGVLLGHYFGQLFSSSYEGFFRFPKLEFSLSTEAVLIAFLAGVLPGCIGASASIRAAFRLSPVEAMHPPAPSEFHSLFLKIRIGKGQLNSLRRITVRRLLARPLRLAFTILGLSMAVAVVVTSMSWNDIIRYLLDTQFQRIQREDLSVTLVTPRPSSALKELAGQRGVLAVEGFRVVPIRLRHLNQKRELVISGRPANPRMRQQLDSQLKPVELPEDGLLLSRYFETEWGIRLGEAVEIETLEGEARRISIPVAGFTDDLVGISAVMRIEPLWGLLREEPVYNLVALQVDPRELSLLYVKLENMPQVATVSIKRALYRGFQSTLGAIIRVSTAILVGFALAISLGVTTNSIRVSYSERAWEMATLRVLGYSRAETFGMLLQEVGVQAALSLVPGCLLGVGLTHLILRGVESEEFRFPVVIDSSTYAWAILMVLVSLAVNGALIHRLTRRLRLADALKERE